MYNFQEKLNQKMKIIFIIDYELLLFLFEYTKKKQFKKQHNIRKTKNRQNLRIYFSGPQTHII